jgi:predicted phosphodiesterase
MTLADGVSQSPPEPTEPTGSRREHLGRLADLLDRQGISIDEIGKVQRVSLYQSLTKNEDGEAEVHDLVGIQFSPAWESGPEWQPVDRGPAIKMPAPKTQAKQTSWPTAVVLPDCQIGFYRLADGTLEPTHDEAAISVALSIVRKINPSLVVLVGDNLDFPEFSGKFRLTPAFAYTTQASIDRATLLCAQVRTAAPNAKVVWLAGNHEERLPRLLLDNAKAAYGIRRGNDPESFPVMSVPYLCRMDEFGVEFRPGYPAANVWVTDRLQIIHGDKVASNGSTAHKYLSTSKTSVVYGHIHRREWAERTREDHDGPRTILAASPGCLCRVDGVVPSTKQGLDLDGRPLRRPEDWQQGLAIIPYHPESGNFVYEQVAIRDGWAMWRGVEFVA